MDMAPHAPPLLFQFVDFQKVRIQESADEIPSGSMPRRYNMGPSCTAACCYNGVVTRCMCVRCVCFCVRALCVLLCVCV